MRVAIVKSTSKDLCLKLQDHGFTIGVTNHFAFGWKFEKELTELDRKNLRSSLYNVKYS
mgnify:CR=1 FL=1